MTNTATPQPAPTARPLADVLDLVTPRARNVAAELADFPAGIRYDKAMAALRARREELAVAVDAYAERHGAGAAWVTLDHFVARDDVSVELQVIAIDAALAMGPDGPANA